MLFPPFALGFYDPIIPLFCASVNGEPIGKKKKNTQECFLRILHSLPVGYSVGL